MSGRHATAADLESYVLGALDLSRIESFEAHCAECDACAAALAGEARLEVAFEQVARRPVRVASPRPLHALRAAAYGAAGLVAMAAAVVLWFGHSPASAMPGAAGAAGAAAAAGEAATPAAHHAMDDGAILDARNDALDGG